MIRRLVPLVALAACEASAPTPRPASPVPAAPALALPQPATGSPEARVAAVINAYRATAGLGPVLVDPALSDGCRAHAEYMRINRGEPQLFALNAHDEDPSLPGATPAGRACGKAANLYPQVPDVESAVHRWMGSLYHRRSVLTPDVDRIGVGYAEVAGGVTVAVQFAFGPLARRAVLYPANGQTDVPLDFVSEVPNPIPTAEAGYPITLQVPWMDAVTNVAGALDDGAEKVPIFLSSPEHPAFQGMPNYGVIALIPQRPLRPGTRYRATISAMWNGAPQTWVSTFTTQPQSVVEVSDDDALLAANGKPVLLRGAVRGATKVTDGLVIVTIERPRTSRVLELQIEASPAGLGPAPEMHGKRIEAEGVLRVENVVAKLKSRSARLIP
jgi:hypothetical protein